MSDKSKKKKNKRNHKKGKASVTKNLDFDAPTLGISDDDFGTPTKKLDKFDEEWDTYIPKNPPPSITNKPSASSSDASSSSSSDETDKEPKKPKKTKTKNGKKNKDKKEKKKKTIHAAVKTTHVIEYGIKHDEIRKQRAEVKAIKEKRRKERLEREAKLSKPGEKKKTDKKSKKTVRSEVKTTHVIEYGIKHSEINKQRAEIKAIKEKRRREKAEREKTPITAPKQLKKTRSVPPKKSVHDQVKTTHVIEYGIKHDEINKQRAEIKAIKEKRRREKAEKEKLLNSKISAPKKRMSIRKKANGSNKTLLEFGTKHEEINKQRAEIKSKPKEVEGTLKPSKAIKEKRRKEKLEKEQKEKQLLKKRKSQKVKPLTPTTKTNKNKSKEELIKECEKLRNELNIMNKIEAKYMILTEHTKQIEQENDRLKKQNATLNEECKQFQLQLNQMRYKYNKLVKENKSSDDDKDDDDDDDDDESSSSDDDTDSDDHDDDNKKANAVDDDDDDKKEEPLDLIHEEDEPKKAESADSDETDDSDNSDDDDSSSDDSDDDE